MFFAHVDVNDWEECEGWDCEEDGRIMVGGIHGWGGGPPGNRWNIGDQKNGSRRWRTRCSSFCHNVRASSHRRRM